jgi:hypothetical protein
VSPVRRIGKVDPLRVIAATLGMTLAASLAVAAFVTTGLGTLEAGSPTHPGTFVVGSPPLDVVIPAPAPARTTRTRTHSVAAPAVPGGSTFVAVTAHGSTTSSRPARSGAPHTVPVPTVFVVARPSTTASRPTTFGPGRPNAVELAVAEIGPTPVSATTTAIIALPGVTGPSRPVATTTAIIALPGVTGPSRPVATTLMAQLSSALEKSAAVPGRQHTARSAGPGRGRLIGLLLRLLATGGLGGASPHPGRWPAIASPAHHGLHQGALRVAATAAHPNGLHALHPSDH